jgi:hypothetical protein
MKFQSKRMAHIPCSEIEWNTIRIRKSHRAIERAEGFVECFLHFKVVNNENILPCPVYSILLSNNVIH